MDVTTLEKATTPFFTTKGIGKGTGLGLPMVQGLMAQSGGRLIMKSKPGEGTTAELWLPVAEINALPEPVVETPRSAPISPMTVMAVDDDSLVLMNTVLMLEDLGHTVIEANSAAEALKRLEHGPLPDVLITDHAMPQMTGGELARILAERHPGLHVILATGYAELPGGEGVGLARLSKPFSQDQLNEALANAVLSR
jgi:CheY-like chemotaxis protein